MMAVMIMMLIDDDCVSAEQDVDDDDDDDDDNDDDNDYLNDEIFSLQDAFVDNSMLFEFHVLQFQTSHLPNTRGKKYERGEVTKGMHACMSMSEQKCTAIIDGRCMGGII